MEEEDFVEISRAVVLHNNGSTMGAGFEAVSSAPPPLEKCLRKKVSNFGR